MEDRFNHYTHFMRAQFLRSSVPLSLLLHLLVLAVMLFVSQYELNKPQEKWVEIELPKQDRSRQIVDTDQGEKVAQAPEDAALSKENRRVEKQQVAKLKPEGVKAIPLKNLGVPLLGKGPGQKAQQESPRWADAREQFGDARQEYVKGLKEGEQTALNTREFVYFSYFQRIRDQLDRAWRPILREQLEKLYRRGRLPASDHEHVTRIVVTLDDRGEIKRVQVLEESGTRDLDDAAVRAFNRAGPFPNPPTGLVQGSGQVEIRWDFILRT